MVLLLRLINYEMFEKEMLKFSDKCEPEILDADDGLFMLYTSGSTGKPKGVILTQAGYILNAGLTQQVAFISVFRSTAKARTRCFSS